MFCSKLFDAGFSAGFGYVDQIDASAELANSFDFDACRRVRHDYRTRFVEQPARAGEGLAEVAGGCGDNVFVWHARCHIVSGAKFEAASMLKCFTGDYDLCAKAMREAGWLNDRDGTHHFTNR
jgi:hypothetical protein